MKKSFRCLCALLACLCVLALCPLGVSAFESIDTDRDSTLTVSYFYNHHALTGAEVKLYYFASVSPSQIFVLTDEYKDYPISIFDLNDDTWPGVINALAGYAEADGHEPAATGKIGEDGLAVFEHLVPGLYLVLIEDFAEGQATYIAQPAVAAIPMPDEAGVEWLYDVTVIPKTSREEIPVVHTYTDRKVIKIWDDEGQEDLRPSSIVVALLRDGVTVDTKAISAATNWRYTWTDLDAYDASGRIDWKVIELDVDGYTVSSNVQGITTTITNTLIKEIPPETEPPETEPEPPETETETETEPPETETETEPEPETETKTEPTTPDEEKLPQTGLLWWPVPVLICLGVVCLIIGALRRKNDEA